MRQERIIEIPKECAYCDKQPVKLVKVKVRRAFRTSFGYEAFVCKEHVEFAIAEAYRTFG